MDARLRERRVDAGAPISAVTRRKKDRVDARQEGFVLMRTGDSSIVGAKAQ